LLEAMAASKPVVATAVNGCPEIVQHKETGYLTPPGDVATWAARVGQLLSQPQMSKEMGRAARKRAETRFSAKATTARTAQLYQQLVQARELKKGAR
jgi:glycosyltransferase involved in cell wall biosynthesis